MRERKNIQADLDVLIVGGGIAGLWLLNRLVSQRYTVALIEKNELGGGQTLASQGIIHGGMKYSFGQQDVHAMDALAEMPALWRDCLEGRGEINLSGVPAIADATYMWSEGSLASRAVSFLASRVLRSRVAALRAQDRPPPFQSERFSGTVYELDECVLDVPALVRSLAAPHAGRIFRLDAAKAEIGMDGALEWDNLPTGRVSIKARRIVVTAGQGFEDLTRMPGLTGFMQQRRPLHMVMVEHDQEIPLFGHCIGQAKQPLLTVTSHARGDGRHVWYLGGKLAEEGVALSPEEQIEAAKDALLRYVPWINLRRRRWRSFRIDRAEVARPGKVRPSGPFAGAAGKYVVAWPTKLALAPLLAQRILSLLPEPTGMPDMTEELAEVPLPSFAEPPWEKLFR